MHSLYCLIFKLIRCRPSVASNLGSITTPIWFHNYNFLLLFTSDTCLSFSHLSILSYIG